METSSEEVSDMLNQSGIKEDKEQSMMALQKNATLRLRVHVKMPEKPMHWGMMVHWYAIRLSR